jgi:hypothetical protein
LPILTYFQKFKKPLENASLMQNPMVSPEDVDRIFSSIEEISTINTALLAQLRTR